jgi:hypothetical protein
MRVYSFGNPALFIPWHEVIVGKTDSWGRFRWWKFRFSELFLGSTEGVRLRISPADFERLKAAAGASWEQVNY